MIRTRPARPEDLAAVRDLLVASWRDTYDSIYGRAKVDALTARWHSPEALSRQLDNGMLRLVAEENGRLSGTASATLEPNATIHLHQLYVHPENKRRGYGAALLTAIAAAFPSARRIRLEVEPENTEALAFYESQGFRRIGDRADRDADGKESRLLILEMPNGSASSTA